MSFNHSKLRGRIIEILGSQKEFARRMGLSEKTISLKMNSKLYWSQEEIRKACEVLNIPESQIADYFFVQMVQEV